MAPPLLAAELHQVTDAVMLIATDQDGVLCQSALRAFLDEVDLARGSWPRRLWHHLLTVAGRCRQRALAERLAAATTKATEKGDEGADA